MNKMLGLKVLQSAIYFSLIQVVVILGLALRTKIFALTLDTGEFSAFIIQQGLYTFFNALFLFGFSQGYISSGLFRSNGTTSWRMTAKIHRLLIFITIIILFIHYAINPEAYGNDLEQRGSIWYIIVGSVFNALGVFELTRYQLMDNAKKEIGIIKVVSAVVPLLFAAVYYYTKNTVIFEVYWIIFGLGMYLAARIMQYRSTTILSLISLHSKSDARNVIASSVPIYVGLLTGGLVVTTVNSFVNDAFSELCLVNFGISRTIIQNYGFVLFSSLSLYFLPQLSLISCDIKRRKFIREHILVFLGLSGMLSFGLFLFPNFVVNILYSSAYGGAVDYLKQGAWSLFFYSFVFIYNYSILSQNRGYYFVFLNSITPAILFYIVLERTEKILLGELIKD